MVIGDLPEGRITKEEALRQISIERKRTEGLDSYDVSMLRGWLVPHGSRLVTETPMEQRISPMLIKVVKHDTKGVDTPDVDGVSITWLYIRLFFYFADTLS
jgi:hypothetical protein